MSFAFSLILCSQPNCSNSNKWTNKQANKHWYTTHISDTRLGNPLLDANEFKVCSTRYRTHTLLSKKRVKSVSNLGKDTKISITSHCVRYFVLNFVSPIPSQGFGSFYDECFLWEKCRTDQPNVVLVRPGIVQPWTSLEKKDDTVKLCLASMAPALHCQGTSRSLSPVQAWKCRCYFVQSPEKQTRNRFFKGRCSTFAPWTMVLCRRWAKITLFYRTNPNAFETFTPAFLRTSSPAAPSPSSFACALCAPLGSLRPAGGQNPHFRRKSLPSRESKLVR